MSNPSAPWSSGKDVALSRQRPPSSKRPSRRARLLAEVDRHLAQVRRLYRLGRRAA